MVLAAPDMEHPTPQIISIRRAAPQLLVTLSAPASEEAAVVDLRAIYLLAERLVGVQSRG